MRRWLRHLHLCYARWLYAPTGVDGVDYQPLPLTSQLSRRQGFGYDDAEREAWIDGYRWGHLDATAQTMSEPHARAAFDKVTAMGRR